MASITVAAPVWTPSTGDVGPTFTVSRTFAAGDRVSIAVGQRDTSRTISSIVFNGVDSAAAVENYPTGTNIAHLLVWELVVSAGGAGNIVVTFDAALAAGNVIIGTAVIGNAVSGSGWRDAALETGNTTNESATLTVGSETGDEVIAWALMRGTSSTMVADGNTTQVGTQAETAATGASHIRMALWRRNGAAPNVAIGGAFNSSNGYAFIAHNVNIVAVTGGGTLPLALGLSGAGTVGGGSTGRRRTNGSAAATLNATLLTRLRTVRLAALWAPPSPIVQGGGFGGPVGDGALPLIVGLAGVGSVAVNGAGALPLVVTLAGTGAVGTGVNGDGTLPLLLGLSGAGSVAIAGAGSLPLVIALAGAGTSGNAVNGAGSLPLVLGLAGAGTVEVQGAGVLPLALALGGAGSVAITGVGALPLVLGFAGAGALGSPPIDGVGTLLLPLSLSGAGSVAVNGLGSLPLAVSLGGAGSVAVSGVGLLPLVLTFAGAGIQALQPYRLVAGVRIAPRLRGDVEIAPLE